MARNLLAQGPGRENRHARAASASTLATKTWRGNGLCFCVVPPGGTPFTIIVKGRVAWALNRLCAAGAAGCTPIHEPGPRWSAYVYDLRALGVAIETLHERHDGDYAGGHGRYVLRCDVQRVDA